MVVKSNDQSRFNWQNKYTSLRHWRIGAFKSVNEKVEIDLAPLTVVVGANSSGKSTLIQSILLLAQNSSRIEEKNSAKSRGMFELNGPLVQLGTFRETVCDLTETKSSQFEFGGNWFAGQTAFVANRTTNLRTGDQELVWDLSLRPVEKNLDSGVAQLEAATVDFSREGRLVSSADVMYKESRFNVDLLKSKYDNFSFKHTSTFDNQDEQSQSKITPKQKTQAVSFQAGLPYSGLVSKNIVQYLFDNQIKKLLELMYDGLPFDPDHDPAAQPLKQYESMEELIEAYVDEIAGFGRRVLQQDLTSEDRSVEMLSRQIQDFLFVPAESFPEEARKLFGLLNPENSNKKQLKDADNFLENLTSRLRARFDEIYGDSEWTQESTFCLPNGKRSTKLNPTSLTPLQRSIRSWNRYLSENVLYLGPLRVGPRATYGIGASVENSNIPLGESGEFFAKKVFIDDTPRLYPVIEQGQLKDARFTLGEAVTYWYQHLAATGEENEINVDAPNRQGYPLKIGTRTLANVGFGASQILPVIGLCLSASPGDLILLEQPELHLNPGMQQKLADFLLAMVKTGRQIIVETHSEYLITRLRRDAATDPEDHKFFTIVFVERDPKVGTSYRTVNVDEQGDLSEWPKGFFDHVAEDLRILMRKAAERQAKKNADSVNIKDGIEE